MTGRHPGRAHTHEAVSTDPSSAAEGSTGEGEHDETTVVALGAAGAFVFGLGVAVDSRALRLLGLGAAGAGAIILARERLEERGRKIDAAEDSIKSTLDELDPVARAQVLKGIAEDFVDG